MIISYDHEKMLEIFENTANWGRFQDVWFKFFGIFCIIFSCIGFELFSGALEPYSEDQINSAVFYDPDRYRRRNERIENATRMRNEKDSSKFVKYCLVGLLVLGRRLEIQFVIYEIAFFSFKRINRFVPWMTFGQPFLKNLAKILPYWRLVCLLWEKLESDLFRDF